jgi:predicted porin
MNKMLMAAAALCAAGAAQAQSAVQLYGIIDGGLLYQSRAAGGAGSGVTYLDGANSPSIYGLRGGEDLGGGMKVGFQLEGGFSSARGSFGSSNGNLFGRNATVQLSGDFGSIKAGLQMTPFFLALYASEPRGMSQFGSGLQPYLNSFGITGLFDSNTAVYSTPVVAGLSASLGLALGEVAGNNRAGRRSTGSITYARGPLLLNAAFLNAAAPLTAETTARGRTVGAGYAIGALSMKASLTNYRNVAAGRLRSDVDVASVGGDYRISPAVSINAAAYRSTDDAVAGDRSVMISAGSDYRLSPRTTLYGQLAAVRNTGAMQINLALNVPASYAAAPNARTTGLNVGMRHTF